MSNALLAMIAKRKAMSNRMDTLSPKTGRNRYRLLPSWRIAKTAPAGIPVADWVAKFLAANAAGDVATLMKMVSLAQNTPAGYTPEAKLEWMVGFFADFGQHFIKDAAGQVKAVTVCPSKTFGRPCSVCDEIGRGLAQAVAMGDQLAKKRIEDMKSGGKVLLNVLDLGGPNPNQVQILSLAPSAFNGQKGVGGIVSLFTDWPNMLNLQGGADIIVEKSGSGMDTRYGVSAVPSQTNVDLSLLAQLHDLDAFVNQESAESEQRALAGVSAMTGLLPAPSRPSLESMAGAAAMLDDVPSFAASQSTLAQAAAQPAAQTQGATLDMDALFAQASGGQQAPWAGAADPALEAAAQLAAQQVQQPAAQTVATPVQQPVQQQAAPAAQPAMVGGDALDDLLKGL